MNVLSEKEINVLQISTICTQIVLIFRGIEIDIRFKVEKGFKYARKQNIKFYLFLI